MKCVFSPHTGKQVITLLRTHPVRTKCVEYIRWIWYMYVIHRGTNALLNWEPIRSVGEGVEGSRDKWTGVFVSFVRWRLIKIACQR